MHTYFFIPLHWKESASYIRLDKGRYHSGYKLLPYSFVDLSINAIEVMISPTRKLYQGHKIRWNGENYLLRGALVWKNNTIVDYLWFQRRYTWGVRRKKETDEHRNMFFTLVISLSLYLEGLCIYIMMVVRVIFYVMTHEEK